MSGQVSVERFKREIALAARLQHPHIVPLLSAGDAGGLPYFTMPLIEGESLRARLVKQGELPLNEAVRVLRDIASALAYAHERGIVHRDIKPDDVLMSGGSAMIVVGDTETTAGLSAVRDCSLVAVGIRTTSGHRLCRVGPVVCRCRLADRMDGRTCAERWSCTWRSCRPRVACWNDRRRRCRDRVTEGVACGLRSDATAAWCLRCQVTSE